MQCISVHDDQPTQRLLLKANSCNVHCATLMTENGTEKLDNELIATLFENITMLAQLHQFTRAEGKTTKDSPPRNQKKRHITQKVTVSWFPPAIRTLDCFPDVFACNVTTLDQCCVNIVRRRNNQPSRNVTCMAEIHN